MAYSVKGGTIHPHFQGLGRQRKPRVCDTVRNTFPSGGWNKSLCLTVFTGFALLLDRDGEGMSRQTSARNYFPSQTARWCPNETPGHNTQYCCRASYTLMPPRRPWERVSGTLVITLNNLIQAHMLHNIWQSKLAEKAPLFLSPRP